MKTEIDRDESPSVIEEERDNEQIFSTRLGLCESCEAQEAKYNCPRCSTKSCSLACVKSHKVSHMCDGIRDKTCFKSISQFTELDLLSDYRLLEEASRSVDSYYRDPLKGQTRFNKELPVHLHRLRCAAAQKGTQLRFLPQSFSRHKANTTYLDWKTRKIEWRIQWKLTWLRKEDNSTTFDERVPEETILGLALNKNLNAHHQALCGTLDKIHIFLAAEHTPGQGGRFYKMDLGKTLAANLKGVSIVENPIFHLVRDDQLDNYPLVGSTDPLAKRPKNAKYDTTDSKKSKMTFYDVSDGELSDD